MTVTVDLVNKCFIHIAKDLHYKENLPECDSDHNMTGHKTSNLRTKTPEGDHIVKFKIQYSTCGAIFFHDDDDDEKLHHSNTGLKPGEKYINKVIDFILDKNLSKIYEAITNNENNNPNEEIIIKLYQ